MRNESDKNTGGPLLTKSVAALAIEPLTMSLTVTSRKAYDVMLWIAQRQAPTDDGFFSSPVAAILKGYGSDTRLSERLQEYLEQMVHTTVVWRPLTISEPVSLTLDGIEGEGRVTDEQRTFPLLAEVRRFQRGGQAWVSWFYPPSIREQLINPERWAQIELATIARLSTYTAVALYEICARYKDSPAGISGRYEPDFLCRVLREQSGAKPRPWRKFKHELLGPAISEINEASEIQVELVEHRRGRTVSEVQFKVSRKQAPARESTVEPVDVALTMEAASLGVRESELENLLLRYDPVRVRSAIATMQSQRARPGGASIARPAAYLATILANMPQVAKLVANAPTSTPAIGERPSHPVPAPKQDLLESPQATAPSVSPPSDWESLRVHALKLLAERFGRLPPGERIEWLAELGRERPESITPASKRRLDAGQWESPVVKHLVLTFYAEKNYGEDWVREALEAAA